MSELKVVSFRIGSEEYAIDIMKVDSIIQVEKITWIPETPSFVEGIIDFRGTVIPIVSGRKKFSISSECDDKSKMRAIVINHENRKVGLFVDEVKEVISISQDTLEEPPLEVSNESNGYISAISTVKDRMVIILDVEKMLDEKELVTFSNSGG